MKRGRRRERGVQSRHTHTVLLKRINDLLDELTYNKALKEKKLRVEEKELKEGLGGVGSNH